MSKPCKVPGCTGREQPEVPLRTGLLRMAEIIERGWNAGAFEAFDAAGREVAGHDPTAVKWSVFGSTSRAASELALPIKGFFDSSAALDMVVQALGHDMTRGWTPAREWERDVLRQQAEVAGALRMAAQLAPDPVHIAEAT